MYMTAMSIIQGNPQKETCKRSNIKQFNKSRKDINIILTSTGITKEMETDATTQNSDCHRILELEGN